MTTSNQAEVAIVGGGVIGSATAYFLTKILGFGGSVVVIEGDPTYTRAASALSTSGFRQQFSTAINIALSKASIEFLRTADEALSLGGEKPGIHLVENGYLYLGGRPQLELFETNHRLQQEMGVDVRLMSRAELERQFPWMNFEGIEVGSYGLGSSGWFDGYLLMNAFRRCARAAGATYANATVTDIRREARFELALDDGQILRADTLVLAAGTGTPSLARCLGLVLPVTPAKQTVFTFASPISNPGMPFLFTPEGVFCRPEGQHYLAGTGIEGEAAADDFEPEFEQFEAEVWPKLALRVPSFTEARFRGAWAGHYDMSRFDHNPLIGPVADHPGLLVACGFSGHGMMQSPGVGRGLAELVAYGQYQTVDLSPLGFDRIARGAPLLERIQY